MKCPKCKGAGKFDMFTGSEPCDACRGSREVLVLHQLRQPSPLRVALSGVFALSQ